MAMEVHNTFGHDMDRFNKECAHLFHNRRLESHLSLSFCIQFFMHHVNIVFYHALAFVIKRKIVLAGDVCSKTPITIKFHDLHVGNNRRVVCEIVSYNKKD
jgi:hypothetical protein